MSTSGSYTPPAAPTCPYPTRMTRAAAIALRTAGTLDVQCAIVITDGPAIGPSATVTEIELNPVSATAFGEAARVFTTYDNEAWAGRYNIDIGAAGSVIELADNLGNVAKDVDANAPTVHTQFPWGNANFRDNYVEDCTLTGWAAQVGLVQGNRFRESTVDLTGKTSGAIQNSEFTQTTFTVAGSSAVNIGRSTFQGGSAAITGTAFTSLDSDFINSVYTSPSGNGVNATRCRFAGCTLSPTSGSFIPTDCDWQAVTFIGTGARSLTFTGLRATETTFTQNRAQTGSGDTISNSRFDNTAFTLSGAASGAVNQAFTGLDFSTATVDITSVVVTPLSNLTIQAASLTFNGAAWNGGRIANGANITSVIGVQTNVIVELAGNRAILAANSNKLANKSFDDVS